WRSNTAYDRGAGSLWRGRVEYGSQLNEQVIPQQISRMRRLFVPTAGPSDWRRLLADPQKQWRPEKSAFEAAVSWEAARQSKRGLPPEVAAALDSQDEFRG